MPYCSRSTHKPFVSTSIIISNRNSCRHNILIIVGRDSLCVHCYYAIRIVFPIYSIKCAIDILSLRSNEICICKSKTYTQSPLNWKRKAYKFLIIDYAGYINFDQQLSTAHILWAVFTYLYYDFIQKLSAVYEHISRIPHIQPLVRGNLIIIF